MPLEPAPGGIGRARHATPSDIVPAIDLPSTDPGDRLPRGDEPPGNEDKGDRGRARDEQHHGDDRPNEQGRGNGCRREHDEPCDEGTDRARDDLDPAEGLVERYGEAADLPRVERDRRDGHRCSPPLVPWPLRDLDGAVWSVAPLLPRARVALDLVEAGEFVEHEPYEGGTHATLAVRCADLARVRAAAPDERHHLLDRPERAFVGQEIDEAAMAGARDMATATRSQIRADPFARGPDVEDPGRCVVALGGLAAPPEDLVVRRDQRVVALAQLDRHAQRVGQVRLGDVGRRLLAGAPPGLDPPVEDVEPLGGEAVQAQEPIAADRLAIEADVVVEHDVIAVADAPSTQDLTDLIARRDEPLALGVAGLRGRALERELLVEVAVHRAWDVSLVEDATIRGDVDDPHVGIAEVLGEPLDADEGTRGC